MPARGGPGGRLAGMSDIAGSAYLALHGVPYHFCHNRNHSTVDNCGPCATMVDGGDINVNSHRLTERAGLLCHDA